MLRRTKEGIVGNLDEARFPRPTIQQRLITALALLHQMEPDRERWYREAMRRQEVIDRRDRLILQFQQEINQLKEQIETLRRR